MTEHDLYLSLESALKSYLQDEQILQVKKAYEFAKKAHEGQVRQSGNPYITHPLKVAIILSEIKQDVHSIMASLLHDTLEDTPVDKETLLAEFGEEVTSLVEGVTKLGKIYFGTTEEAQAENYRKLFLAMAEDLRVVVIKLADRLHNMRTLQHLKPEKQKRISIETMDIFAPLALRLGIAHMRWELEDLAFSYLNTDAFQEIRALVDAKRHEREDYISIFIESVQTLLAAEAIKGAVTGRPKHFYSIYKKLSSSEMNYDELYDLMGVRILTESVRECYEALGAIHSAYKPVSGRIKDYIAMPKTNMYQSLHTTVIGPQGKPIEVQIRTEDMHQVAEYGIAAHWRYKEDKEKDPYKVDFAWLRQILESQKEDDESYLQHLKLDLFSEEVFVFTPKGDVQVLPVGATPVDFAYKVHTDIGHRCTGAKVNGRIVSLDYQLKNGDRLEILTGKVMNPKVGWVEFVKTRQAKSKIKAWFRKQQSTMNRQKGLDLFQKSLLAAGYIEKEIKSEGKLTAFFEKHEIKSYDDLYLLIAYGEITMQAIMQFLDQQDASKEMLGDKTLVQKLKHPTRKQGAPQGVQVMGEDNIAVHFAKCCNPLPGDEIIGFVTVGHGVSIHRTGCPNVINLSQEFKDRLVDVLWQDPTQMTVYPVTLVLEAFDRAGLVNEVVAKIVETKRNIREVRSHKTKTGQLEIWLQVEMYNLSNLHQLKEHIMTVQDVYSVYRPRQA
ncbi:(p)ppGpp synthetase [Candidatus Marinamargulisbacteria bacterium SCGC AG-439-L15]|nr:(p)ppGpp synthetase [Candidatus Marinamargulisbacteria bacterium SCGC AG-439-L15]